MNSSSPLISVCWCSSWHRWSLSQTTQSSWRAPHQPVKHHVLITWQRKHTIMWLGSTTICTQMCKSTWVLTFRTQRRVSWASKRDVSLKPSARATGLFLMSLTWLHPRFSRLLIACSTIIENCTSLRLKKLLRLTLTSEFLPLRTQLRVTAVVKNFLRLSRIDL